MSLALGKMIGEGSFGKVYRLGEDKVVKYIHLDRDGLLDYIEPYILSILHHPNIMNSDQISIGSGLLKILMSSGQPISEIPVSEVKKDKLNMVREVREGLTYLHSLSIVHGDIKPSNILRFGSCYKISDFGLSILLRSDPQKIDKLIYTESYRPPENYNWIVSRKSDVWAFGKMLEGYFTSREMEKRGYKLFLKRKLDDRICFSDKNNFMTDSEILKKNEKLNFQKSWKQIFCHKLRNDKSKYLSCSGEYLNFEESLFKEGKFDIHL